MIQIEIDDRPALDALADLLRKGGNLGPALMEIGEDITASTKQRFADGVAPDGTPWEANSPVTVAIYDGLFASPGAKKPLVGESRRLASDITWQLIGGNTVAIGSPLPYAAMQQLGGTKSQWPHLWGDIPARPYLGLSDEDEQTILDITSDYLIPQ